MKKPLIAAAVLLALAIFAIAGPVSNQTTIGASTTQVTTADTYCRSITFQNNATHSMRVGDSTTTSSKGVLLASGSPGGSFTVGPDHSDVTINAKFYWVAGTQNDVLDWACRQ